MVLKRGQLIELRKQNRDRNTHSHVWELDLQQESIADQADQ